MDDERSPGRLCCFAGTIRERERGGGKTSTIFVPSREQSSEHLGEKD